MKSVYLQPGRSSVVGRVLLEGRPVQIADVLSDPEYALLEAVKTGGYRTCLGVPLLREGNPIGVIILARKTVAPFTDKQIELATTFADQAVIAIENARLFEAEQRQSRELSQALERQTATAEVLNVISRSTFQLQPVLDSIVQTASRLCNAETALIFMFRDEKLHLVATSNASSAFVQHALEHPLIPGREFITGRTFLERQKVHLPDCLADPEYTLRDFQAIGQHRSMLGVPLLREGSPIGVITLWRTVVLPFTDTEIDFIKTFADQAVIAIENVRLFNETKEALEQQTTSEILRFISNLSTDLQPVLDAVAENAARLCGATDAQIFRVQGDNLHLAASFGPLPRPLPLHGDKHAINRDWVTGRAVVDRQTIHVNDLAAAEMEFPLGVDYQRRYGHRTTLATPLLRQGVVLGAILIRRMEVQRFSEKQVRLLETFADQAAIAIENTRLLKELRESLQQQTATADVLKVISRSAFDLQAVLDTLVKSAVQLCEAEQGHIARPTESGFFQAQANFGFSPELKEEVERIPFKPGRESVTGRALLEHTTVQIVDAETDSEYKLSKLQSLGGYHSMIGTPLLREGTPIGVFGLARRSVRPFTDKQMALLTTFADQAVIAIENARLFEEVQARTRELTESLQQQTATADVLKVISRSAFDLPTVLQTLVKSAARLCGADMASIMRPEAGKFAFAANFGFPQAFVDLAKAKRIEAGRGTLAGRVLNEGRPVQILDALTDPEYSFNEANIITGQRSMLGVPLMREGDPIGIIILARSQVWPFTNKQIDLVETFADQAVIAIENARLFNEVRARTDELSESLEQQTATAEVLKVISSSPGELELVFDAILENAVQICGAKFGSLVLFEGNSYRRVASHNAPTAYVEAKARDPVRPLATSPTLSRVATTKQVIQVTDMGAEQPEEAIARLGGARTVLCVPMLKDNRVVGVISIYRQEVRPFTDKQTELVTNFSAQAVIAIENTRLLNELRTRTNELAQSVDELQALGEVSQAVNSTLDLETVLTTIVSRAAELSCTDAGAIYVFNEEREEFHLHATHGMSETMIAAISDQHIGLGDGNNIAIATTQRKPVQVADARDEPASAVNDIVLREGYRSILIIPLLRPDHIVGALVVRRKTPGDFLLSTIELLQTFGDQSVVAIQNARLYENVEARTRELAQSLEDLRATQDRLVQTEKLASLGQLTAGIAHEIKNPLNFVNNFSALAIELIGELQEKLQAARLDSEVNAQIAELADMLKGNLGKVVEHGKRADSIVKNMLLHSRQESGEHRPVGVNALVAESLNLAYHGARAAKQGFNITLEQSLDPAAGKVDVFPQEITRVLLNLISNGFYAATKRKAEANSGDYEPTLTAMTKDLGDSVEIKIRDNGTGIPPEVRDKIFNPFFTTKPAGEGTGLGLSLSYDIIVKQHSGSIEVDTQPGEFTEFTIVLPRSAASAQPGEGR